MIYLFLAQGFEEIEAITPIDILRRASISVRTVSISDSLEVEGAHNIIIKADMRISEIKKETVEMLILPGGPGTSNLEKSKELDDLLEYAMVNKITVAAICAAPKVLGQKGYLDGKEATCYPGYEGYLKGATISNKKVVVSDNIITSRGPGTAMDFGFKIVSELKDENTANNLMKAMLYY